MYCGHTQDFVSGTFPDYNLTNRYLVLLTICSGTWRMQFWIDLLKYEFIYNRSFSDSKWQLWYKLFN